MNDVVLDTRTAKLVACVRAYTLIAALPRNTAQSLNDAARAARLFSECDEPALVRDALSALLARLAALDEEKHTDVIARLEARADDLMAYLGRSEKLA